MGQFAHYFENFCPIERTVMIINEMYVSVLPRVLPNTDIRLSDEQKQADFDDSMIGPPSVLLVDFLKSGYDIAQNIQKIRNMKNVDVRRSLIAKTIPHAIIPVKVWNRDFSFSPDQFVKSYNRLIALDFPLVLEYDRIVNVLKSKPWVLFITLAADGASVIAIVPLDNDDYHLHRLFFEALCDEFKSDGLEVSCWCSELTAMMAQTYDARAWYNEDCVLYELPREYLKYCEEG